MNKIKSLVGSILVAAACLGGGSAGAIEGSTLNLILGYPQVDTNPVGGCAYDATAQTLTIESQPWSVPFDASGTNIGIVLDEALANFGGTLTLVANIDNAGNLVPGGGVELRGTVIDAFSNIYGPGVLMKGTVSDFGIRDDGTSDIATFRIEPDAVDPGALAALFPSATDDIGANFQLVNSTYAGSSTATGFAGNWACDGAKGTVGPTPGGADETCNLVLTKTVSPDQVGPFAPMGDDDDSDSDSDSNLDTNGNGDTDDSDADSSADSVGDVHGHNRWDEASGSYYWCTDPYHNDPVPECGCSGKVSELVLQYNGAGPVDIVANRIGPFAVSLGSFTGVNTGDTVVISGSGHGSPGFSGTLGVAIEVVVVGGDTVTFHTSCSQPIGPGLVAGDFEVISGTSKKLSAPLCPMPAEPCAGGIVTYTYVVTNNGSTLDNVTVTDDKLGLIGTAGTLATGESATYTEQVCITETTTSIGDASGTLPSGDTCAAASVSATVEVLLPPEPDPCNGGWDTDSDSGIDHNGNTDTDDSDADSGDADCDGDSDELPPHPVEAQGCTPGYWKNLRKHRHAWEATDYLPGQKFDAMFGVDAQGNKSLLKSLKQGGGGSVALGRHAVAALLNASNPDVDYFFTVPEVISIVQSAYESYDFELAKDMLEQQNEQGCPLN